MLSPRWATVAEAIGMSIHMYSSLQPQARQRAIEVYAWSPDLWPLTEGGELDFAKWLWLPTAQKQLAVFVQCVTVRQQQSLAKLHFYFWADGKWRMGKLLY